MRLPLHGRRIMTSVPTFRVTVGIESPVRRGYVVEVPGVLVDTGADASWIPRPILESLGIRPESTDRYEMANGEVLERQLGYAIVHVQGRKTVDEVVFGEPKDSLILGAHTLDGLNVKVDTKHMRLVDAGPRLVAVA
jgi:predicted aspartyl protease